MSFTLRGQTGAVYVGPYRAATLGAWTFTPNGSGGVVQATVVHRDAYWSTRPATELRLAVGRVEWRWPLDAVAVETGIYPVSGPPEER